MHAPRDLHASGEFMAGTDVVADVTLWFESPLSSSVEIPAGTIVRLQESGPTGGRLVETIEAILLTPPTIVALDGWHPDGGIESLLPRARQDLSLGLPLSRPPEDHDWLRVALAGHLWGAVLRVVLWWSLDGTPRSPRSASGPWELWYGSASGWRMPEATLGARDPFLPQRDYVAGRSIPAPEDLQLPSRPTKLKSTHPLRWWLRLAQLRGEYARPRVLQAVSAQVIGGTISATLLPEGRAVAALGAAAVPQPSAVGRPSLPAGTGAGSGEALAGGMQSLIGCQLPFRLDASDRPHLNLQARISR